MGHRLTSPSARYGQATCRLVTFQLSLHTQLALMNFHKRQVLCFGDGAGMFRSSGCQRPERTGLLPRTAESARSHEPAGRGCQQPELVIDPSESATVTAITNLYWR